LVHSLEKYASMTWIAGFRILIGIDRTFSIVNSKRGGFARGGGTKKISICARLSGALKRGSP
jgi:hypothetical protein